MVFLVVLADSDGFAVSVTRLRRSRAVEPLVEKRELSEPVEGDDLHETGWDDLVRINVVAAHGDPRPRHGCHLLSGCFAFREPVVVDAAVGYRAPSAVSRGTS